MLTIFRWLKKFISSQCVCGNAHANVCTQCFLVSEGQLGRRNQNAMQKRTKSKMEKQAVAEAKVR